MIRQLKNGGAYELNSPVSPVIITLCKAVITAQMKRVFARASLLKYTDKRADTQM